MIRVGTSSAVSKLLELFRDIPAWESRQGRCLNCDSALGLISVARCTSVIKVSTAGPRRPLRGRHPTPNKHTSEGERPDNRIGAGPLTIWILVIHAICDLSCLIETKSKFHAKLPGAILDV